MPIVNVPGVGQVNFPDDMSHNEIVGAIESDVIPQYQQHLEKTGFVPALKAAGRSALGATELALGEAFNSDKLRQLAEEQKQKAAQTFEPTTEADIAAAQGILPTAGAYASKYVTEPLGGIAGRFGAPIAAGMAAPFIAPEALGGLATGAIATALTDLPAEIGENVERQKEQGKEVDLLSATTTGLAQAALAGFGVPGTGALNKVLGPQLLREAEILAPKVLKGQLTREQAIAGLTGKAESYARSVGVNAITGTGLMVGTEELRRAQAGQEGMTPGELGETALTAGLLAPIFGGLHPVGRGAAEAKIGEAAGKRQTKLDAIEAKNQAREEAFFRIEQEKLTEQLAQEEAAKKAQEDFDAANAPNKFGNFAPEGSKLAKSIADAVNLPEQESIKQATKARDTAFEDLPKNIASLAKRPELPSIDNVTRIDDNFTKAIGTAPNAGFLKNIKNLELNAENAPKIQQEIENYNGTSKTVLNNLKQFSNRLEDIKNGNDARVNERRASENLSIFGQPEPGVTAGNEAFNRLRDYGAPVDVSAARARKESIYAPIEAATKPTTPNLLTTLRKYGGINLSDLRELKGETRKVEKRGYYNVFNQRAKSLMEHIESGRLDDYLPYQDRMNTAAERGETFDAKPAYDFLAEKIKNEETVYHFEDAQRMAEARNELRSRQEEPSDINQRLAEEAAVEKGMGVKYAKEETRPEWVTPDVWRKYDAAREAEAFAKKHDLGAYRDMAERANKNLDEAIKRDHPTEKPLEFKDKLKDAYGDRLKLAKGLEALTKETIGSIKQALKDRFGKNVERAIERKDLNLIESKDVPAGIDAEAVAYFDKGKVYLIADRLSKEDAGAKLLHEMGVHYGLEGMIGKDIYRDVLRTVNRLNKMDKIATAAHDYVNARYPELKPGSAAHAEEVLARIGETAPNHTLWRRIVAAVKNFLIKKGLYDPNKLSVKDLQDMINSSLHRALREEKKPVALEMREPLLERTVQYAKKEQPRNAELHAILRASGSDFKKEDPSLFQSFRDKPKETAKQYYDDAKTGASGFLRNFETNWFSADAALQRGIRSAMEGSKETWDAVRQAMYQTSTSQALHNEGVAHTFLEMGNIKYNPETYKWEVKKGDTSWVDITKEIKNLAEQKGVSYSEMETYAHRYLEAKRLQGLIKQNETMDTRARQMLSEGKSKADVSKFLFDNKVKIHMSPEQIAAALKFKDKIKGLEKVEEKWHKVRAEVLKFAEDTGLYTKDEAKKLLEVMDYVPFYRIEQLENQAGPREYSRGLLDAARDKKLHGSGQEVNNVFDNMERWISYTIRRGVNNKSAQNLAEVATKYLPEGEVKLVDEVGRGMENNTVGIWKGGRRYLYEFSDPLFVKAFTGIESLAIPAMKGFAKFTNALRQNIVLNPLFSIGQLSQDAFGAMFTSGVKSPFAIPLEVMKEFYKTLRGTSAAHEALRSVGAVGVKDYSAEASRLQAEISAGLRSPTLLQKIKSPLEKFSMASDNAVRQAIFNRTLKETGDKAKAIERAFEVINFRRAGASKEATFMRQTVPFFGAYLQSMNVAAKVISGRGIAPEQKAEAHRVLASTAAKVAALSLIYNIMVSDDDTYKQTDPSIRDRKLYIPGTGMSLPLRPDIFTLTTKILPEHIYQMTMAEATEDKTKAMKALKNGLSNALLGPNVLPQAIKPILEVSTNHDFFTDRAIVGQGLEQLETYKQYTNNTSELAKALGNFGMSPMKIDHLLKAYFGYTGGLALMTTDALINAGSDIPKPDKSIRDNIASVPGMSAFVAKERGTKLMNDFYELRDEVSTAVNTFNKLKKEGTPEERQEYREKNQELLRVKSAVNNMNNQLTKIREAEKRIYNNRSMSGEEKRIKLEEIRQRQERILANVEKLRLRAGF